MKHVIEHELTPEMAKKVTVQAAEKYIVKFAKYNAKLTWTSDTHADATFNIKGIHAAASIDLRPGEIDFEMYVPLLLRPFAKLAFAKVEETFQQWIEKVHDGEID